MSSGTLGQGTLGEFTLGEVTLPAGGEPPAADAFFEGLHPIELGMKAVTAAGLSGVLIE
jgi:hypothetical protein